MKLKIPKSVERIVITPVSDDVTSVHWFPDGNKQYRELRDGHVIELELKRPAFAPTSSEEIATDDA